MLPKQIRAQQEAVDAYERQLAEQKAAEQTDSPEEVTEGVQPNTAEPAPAPVEPAPAPVQADDAALWKQRFQSLQGMFNSQVPALQEQVKELTRQLQDAMQAQAQKPAAAQDSKPLVTKQDEDAFGSDLIDVARRVAAEEFGKRESAYAAQIERLQAQLAEARGQTEAVAKGQEQTARETFFSKLDAAVPNWQAVQSTAECQAWLGARVPGTSQTWNDVLVGAAQRRDIPAVKEVFDTFFAAHPAHDPKRKSQSSTRSELSRQVAPSRTASQANSQVNQRRTYSAADYQNESMRQVRLMQQGKYDQALALEAELNQALADGRVSAT